jgi:hypothetical protein
MNDHWLYGNSGFMSTENVAVPKVDEYFSGKGWKVSK